MFKHKVTCSSEFLNYLDPSCDASFWEELENRRISSRDSHVQWNDEIDELRAKRIVADLDRYDEDPSKDPVLIMMTEWYNDFASCEEHILDKKIFEKQISNVAKVIIKQKFADAEKEQKRCRYSNCFIVENGTGIRKTLLHVAAEGFVNSNGCHPSKRSTLQRNFTEIAAHLIGCDGALLYTMTMGEKWRKLPVEVALLHHNDDMASFLVNSMLEKSRIRMLFEYNYDRDEAPRFRFLDIIERGDMKKTVVAILDSLIKPEWPWLPTHRNKGKPFWQKWHLSPEIATRYQFYFRILDGDTQGRKPFLWQLRDGHLQHDEKFKHQENSCLHALCFADRDIAATRHPTVRLLARKKWESYGQFYVRLHLVLYSMYLFLLTIAIPGAVYSQNLLVYKTGFERFRLFCEVVSLIFSFGYFMAEMDQIQREQKHYWFDFFNYADILGIISVLFLMPMRWFEASGHWHMAAFAYIINFTRVFKYYSAFRGPGIYVRTLLFLVKENLPVFLSVYVVLLISFAGGSFAAMRATGAFDDVNGFKNLKIGGIGEIFQRGIRAIAEGQVFSDTYEKYNTFTVIIVLGNMMVFTLILMNIFIAQLSDSYARAKADAVAHYDIAKAKFVVRIENSRIRCLSLRVKHYMEGAFVHENDLVEELCSDWNILHPEDAIEERTKAIRMHFQRKSLIDKGDL